MRVAVFGAGTMGTAIAMHAARRGLDTTLWASHHDLKAYAALREDRRHPLLPEHVPERVRICGPNELDEAADGAEVAVLGANSHGARSLARLVKGHLGSVRSVISVAKGLEPETHLRISQVYEEELPGARVIAIGGPCLASELAEGLPTAGVWAAATRKEAEEVGARFADRRYQIGFTDDVVGLELCATMKNVAAIGLGMLDGIGSPTGRDFKNAKAALFMRAAHELVELVTAAGGRSETAFGLAGVGDQLVTSLGGRNRLYGELVGAGDPPEDTLAELEGRGLTVEGVDATREVRRLAAEHGLVLPVHTAIHRVLFEDAAPEEILEVLR
jgi:glycerol-3-phosphate dehydrogenase (NAD(P)+)